MRGVQIPWTNGPYVGQPLKVFGKKDHKAHTLIAKEILLQYETYPAKAGSGMIGRVLFADTVHPDQIVVRADGYPILINGKTNITFTPPLTTLSDVTTNVWIEFKGKQEPGGLIVAAQAVFTKNAVGGAGGIARQKRIRSWALRNPKDLSEISIPERAKYLYGILGTTWRTGQMAVQ